MKLQIENLGKVAITVDNNYWNINKDYDRLVVVEVKDKFSTYLSRKPVPAGTQITNREYWIPFSSLKEEILIDYNKFINKYKDQLDYYKESIDKFKEESDNLNKLNKIILTNKEDIDYIKKLVSDCEDVLKELNPVFAKDKERDDRINGLDSKVTSMEGKLDKILNVLSANNNPTLKL